MPKKEHSKEEVDKIFASINYLMNYDQCLWVSFDSTYLIAAKASSPYASRPNTFQLWQIDPIISSTPFERELDFSPYLELKDFEVNKFVISANE
jgi:hypothetical protein